MSKDLSKVVFIFILGLAIYLRLHGITNGFPYIFHPDEPTIVRSALGIRFFPNPGHFDWPHLYIYFNYFFFMVFAKVRDLVTTLGYKPFVEKFFSLAWDDTLIYYFITRFFTAMFSALTVLPVYLTAKKLFGTKAGLFAALAFALIPFNIRHSHYALPEGPMIFFLAWSMYFSSKIAVHDDSANYAGAGAYAGFAASSKYNGGLVSLMVPFAHIVRIFKNGESFLSMNNFLNLVIAGVLAIVAFFAGTPYAALDYSTFTRTDGPQGALWQFTNVGSVSWAEKPLRFVSEMTSRVSDDLAYTFLIVFFVVLVILLVNLITKKRGPLDIYAWMIWLYGFFLLFYVSGFARPRSHYYMIAYPFIAVVVGYFGSYVFEKLEKTVKVGIVVIYALLFLPPLYFSVQQSFIFGNPDTRNLLDTWMSQNLKPGTRVIYSSDDFTAVMDKYKDYADKGMDKISTYTSGYVVVSDSSTKSEKSFSLLKYGDKLKQVYLIKNTFNNGPVISIYEITR